MVKEFKETIGKKEFLLKVDLDKILKELEILKNEYEQSQYVELYYLEFEEEKREYLSKEEYINNIEEIIAIVKSLDNKQLLNYISDFTKKKNGTFNRKSKIVLSDCKNSTFDETYCGRWDFYSLQVRALTDLELELDLYSTMYQNDGF